MSAILLTIDVYRTSDRALKEKVLSLMDACSERGIPIIHAIFSPYFDYPDQLVKFDDLDRSTRNNISGNTSNGIGYNLVADSLIAFKTSFSAYPAVSEFVKSIRAAPVILCGESEACCVMRTAEEFSFNQHNTIIAAEATDLGVEGSNYFMPLKDRRKRFANTGVRIEPISKIIEGLDNPGKPPVRRQLRLVSQNRPVP
jgi:hypothetical protein